MKKHFLTNLSIKYKFILGIVAILSLSLFALFLSMLKRSEGLLIQSIEQRAQLINSNFSVVAAQGIQESSFSNLQSLINEVAAQTPDIKLLIVAYADGTIIATSDEENYPQFGKIKNDFIEPQLATGANAIRHDDARDVLESIRFIFESPVEPEESSGAVPDKKQAAAAAKSKAIGYIYVVLNTISLHQARFDLWKISSLLTMLLMLTSAGVAYWFGAIMTNPIEKLATHVRLIAAGDLDSPLIARSSDEFGQLIGDVDKMRISIKDLTENLEAKVEERTEQLKKASDQLAGAFEEIKVLNEQLKQENLRMGAELEITRQIQQMVLPRQEELLQIKSLDIAGFMEPADEVGGDYYDVLSHNGVIKIGIGDVTGHGLESGVVMLMVQTAVRTLLNSGITDDKVFLDVLNRTIYGNVQRMQANKSLTLALLDYRAGNIRLSGQHEELLLVRKGGQIERIDTIDLGFPIGLDENIAHLISEINISLNPGDGVVLYTDGFTEAENDRRELYGIERLCQVITQNWDLEADAIKNSIIKDVRAFIGKQKVYDDLTLIVLKQR